MSRALVTRPNVVEFVPGSLCRPNTRKTELVLRWCSDDRGALFLREHLDYDDSLFEERLCGYLPLAKLPAAPDIEDIEDYRRALRERFDVHPLANQLPSTLDLVLQALEHCDPVDVVRVSARYLCVVGVARGFGSALAALGGGPFRGEGEPVELRRLARSCLVMLLGVLDCHGSYGPWEHWAKELFEELPRYPEGKHAGHDGGDHDEVCREYDRLLADYLRAISDLTERALELPADVLDGRSQHVTLPSDVWTPEQGLSKLHEALSKKLWLWQGELSSALCELHGQPLSAIAPALSRLFSGESPVPLPDGSEITSDGLSEGVVVKHLLIALIASDLDLTDEIGEAAQKRAEDEAARAEARRQADEQRAREPPSDAAFHWVARLPVAYWIAFLALLFAAVVMCSRAR